MKNKNDGNEKKIMLGVLNCTMDKIGRDSENKTQKLYRCCSNYVLSHRGEWACGSIEKGEPDSPGLICYDRSFSKDQYRPSILIFGKEPIEADELGGIWVLPSP